MLTDHLSTTCARFSQKLIFLSDTDVCPSGGKEYMLVFWKFMCTYKICDPSRRLINFLNFFIITIIVSFFYTVNAVMFQYQSCQFRESNNGKCRIVLGYFCSKSILWKFNIHIGFVEAFNSFHTNLLISKLFSIFQQLKISRKTNISYHLIRTRMCTY